MSRDTVLAREVWEVCDVTEGDEVRLLFFLWRVDEAMGMNPVSWSSTGRDVSGCFC